MKRPFALLAPLLALACSLLAACEKPAAQPCDPPLEVPAGIVARTKAQFEEGRTEPPPPISEADRAAYQAMMQKQAAADWANLCYYRTANNDLILAAPLEPERVVFMGDSITQLWANAHPAFFNPVNVNRGISGQTTPQMLLRFRRDVIDLKPAAVHILAGINDIAGNTGPTTLTDITNNITSMVELAKANNIRVILATPLPAATFNWAPALKPAAAVRAYADWIRSYAITANLVVADYYAALATPDGALKPEFSPDGVHPNKAGYDVMEPITRAAIASALGK